MRAERWRESDVMRVWPEREGSVEDASGGRGGRNDRTAAE